MKKTMVWALAFLFAAVPVSAVEYEDGLASSEEGAYEASSGEAASPLLPVSATPLTGYAGTDIELMHAGDKIKIEVYGEPDLSRTFTVDTAGKINYPLLGEIYVEGLSLDELKAYLFEKLGTDYIVNPQIDITYVESPNKSVAILGHVKAPGNYILTSRSTLVRMLSQIGGFLPEASTSNVKVVRTDRNGKKFPSLVDVERIMSGEAEDFPLEPGDLIYVERLRRTLKTEKELEPFVTVMGQVSRAGNYTYIPGMSLVRAIAQAGGFLPTASVNNVRIVRTVDGREKVTVVNAGRIMAGQAEDFKLEENDLVVVQESFF